MKASLGNLSINYIDGHLIKIDNTNLGTTEPYKIIIKNNTTTLIAYLYEDNLQFATTLYKAFQELKLSELMTLYLKIVIIDL